MTATATWTCTRCLACEMSRDEYVAHLAIVHNWALRLGKIIALALVS